MRHFRTTASILVYGLIYSTPSTPVNNMYKLEKFTRQMLFEQDVFNNNEMKEFQKFLMNNNLSYSMFEECLAKMSSNVGNIINDSKLKNMESRYSPLRLEDIVSNFYNGLNDLTALAADSFKENGKLKNTSLITPEIVFVFIEKVLKVVLDYAESSEKMMNPQITPNFNNIRSDLPKNEDSEFIANLLMERIIIQKCCKLLIKHLTAGFYLVPIDIMRVNVFLRKAHIEIENLSKTSATLIGAFKVPIKDRRTDSSDYKTDFINCIENLIYENLSRENREENNYILEFIELCERLRARHAAQCQKIGNGAPALKTVQA